MNLAIAALLIAGCAAPSQKRSSEQTPPKQTSAPRAQVPAPAPAPAPALTPEQRAQAAANQRAAAIANAKAAAAREPMNWRVFNELGVVYYNQAMYDQAIAAFQQALALQPVTNVIEAEAKQEEAAAAKRAALEAKRQAEVDRLKQQQAQKEMNELFGMVFSMAGSSGNAQTAMNAQMLQPVLESLNNQAFTTPVEVPPLSPEVKAESSLKSKREIAAVYANLGMAYFGKKSFPEAVAAFDNVTQLDPSRTDVLKTAANAQYRLSKYDECIVTLTRYHAIAPVEPESMLLLSESFHALGMEQQADKVFSSFLAKQNATAADAVKLGKLCLTHCRYAEAADFLARARQTGPESNAGRGYLGISMIGLAELTNETAQSLFQLRTAEAVCDKFHIRKYDRGVLVAGVVRGSPAERAGIRQGDFIRSAGGTDVNDVQSLRQLVMRTQPGCAIEMALLREGQPNSVVAVVGDLAEANPASRDTDEPPLAMLQAEAQFGLLQPEKAISLLLDVAKPQAEPRAWYMLARGYDETGNREKASEAYAKALEAFGSADASVPANGYIQVCRAAMGKGDEAIRTLERNLASVPLTPGGGAEQWCLLGFAYEKMGRIPEAMEILGRCQAANPAYSKVGAALARLGRQTAPDRDKALADADAARQAGDKAAAVAKLAEAYRLTPAGQKKEEIRLNLIKLAAGMEQSPYLTTQAQDHYLRGNAALKAAKNPMDLGRSLSEFQWAVYYAPWVGDLYFNTSAVKNLQNQNAAAVSDLKLYLAAKPNATNVEGVLNRLYEFDYQREQKLRELESAASF